MASTAKLIKQLVDNLRHPQKETEKKWDIHKIIYPFRIIFHPITALHEIKYENKGSVLIANIILTLFFIETFISRTSTGFIFNMNKPTDINLWIIFLQTVVIVVLWVLTNWALCTLMDGEGTIREIWIASNYALMPQVLLTIPVVLISHVLTYEETAFLNIFNTVMVAWTVLLILLSVMIIQQYTLGKTILSMFMSAVGIIAIMFLGVLLVSLFQQVYIFILTIYKELSFRG